MVTEFVLSESVTAIGSRGGGKAGFAVYEYITDNCEVVFVDKGMLEKAINIYLKYDGTLSVADAVSVYVMNSRGITKILSFDSDFDKVDGIRRIH